MPIIDLQRRIREAGRIRAGDQVGEGKSKHPRKLQTFRLTAKAQDTLEECARHFGGKVTEWKDAPEGPQWELYTEANQLDVLVPPGDFALSQWYELWNRGGCVRRCIGEDSELNMIEGVVGGDCLCDPEKRQCEMTTRLSVLLPAVQTLGLWRLDTGGYYAATELAGTMALLDQVRSRAGFTLVPAVLRIDQRRVKRIDPEQGAITRDFIVPVLDIRMSALALAGPELAGQALVPVVPDWSAGAPNGLTPVGEGEPVSVAAAVEQAAAPRPARTPRKKAQEPIKPTGKRPRGRGATKPDAEPEQAQEVLDLPQEGQAPEPVQASQGTTPAAAAAEASQGLVGADAGQLDAGLRGHEVESQLIPLDERREQLQSRLAALPGIVGQRVKDEWPSLNLPRTLKRSAGWNDTNLTWCERLVTSAEESAIALLVDSRQECAKLSRELGLDDDERHALVEDLVGKPGLTECTLDELVAVYAELNSMAEATEPEEVE